ncbi:MAG: shikimate dehydrogenase [Gammaproteobacteria bacterium]|nr:shikimate dehydrogenase [Gammaproteobacteria bacterium]
MSDQYAVMGNPIAHSKSPNIHRLFAEQTQQDIEYNALLVDIDDFPHAVGEFSAAGGKGLNITVPFKQNAWDLCSEHSQRAQRAGAVNTIIINSPGDYHGDNTDGIGLVHDLKNNSIQITNKKLLLLGAGGAARGIIEPLLQENPTLLHIANRTESKAHALAELFSDLGNIKGSGFDVLAGKSFDLIINATAASLEGKIPSLPDNILATSGNCYDLMYAKKPTAFVQWGIQHGATQSIDGLGMLVEQAAESFYLWRGVRPDTMTVIQALKSKN